MSFFNELKRRNVFRVGIAYAITGWLLAQVADVFLENFGAPDWVIKTTLLAILIGFPVALLFAWAFELTPEGLKREKDIDRSRSIAPQTGRKLDRAIIVVLALAVVFLLYQQFAQRNPVTPAAPGTAATASEREAMAAPANSQSTEKSIAVLPFRDMSAAQDQAYFGEGIAEELLNALVKLEGVKVASRTSAFSLADDDLDIPNIAERLGVNHILEGSVRTSGNKVRVTAQLIDVSEDVHLWSETYDGDLDDIFEIQDEITGKITAAMKLQFGDDTLVSAADELTSNAEAYQLYLQGRHFWRQRSPELLHRAVELFKQAVALDPEFHQAWSNLGIAYINLPDYDRNYAISESFKNALAAAGRALELNPTSTEARLVKAIYSELHCDTNSAAEQYLAAIEDDPTDPTARHWYAIFLVGVGHIEQASELIEEAIEIDPLISALISMSAYTKALQGHTQESIELARQADALGFRGGDSELVGLMRLMADERQAAAESIRQIALSQEDAKRTKLFTLFADAVEDPSATGAFEQYVGRAEDYRSLESAEISDFLTLLGSSYLFEFNSGVECPLLGQLTWSSTFREQRGTPEFFELMERRGTVDFWREYGWPDDCASLDQTLAECPR